MFKYFGCFLRNSSILFIYEPRILISFINFTFHFLVVDEMSDRKRMRRSSSCEDKEKSIDWAKEYFKKEEELRKTKEELKEANEKLHAVNEKLDAVHEKLDAEKDKLSAVNEEVKEALRLNTDLAVANKELEMDLISSNTELLQEKKSLSASGVVELFESRNFVCAPSNCKGRQFKYEWLYNKCETFKNNVQKYVGSNISDRDVGLLGKDLYASASHDIHGSLNNGNEVIIRRSNYQKDQLMLLEAICQTMYVRYTTI